MNTETIYWANSTNMHSSKTNFSATAFVLKSEYDNLVCQKEYLENKNVLKQIKIDESKELLDNLVFQLHQLWNKSYVSAHNDKIGIVDRNKLKIAVKMTKELLDKIENENT
jgi:hypothetical protein